MWVNYSATIGCATVGRPRDVRNGLAGDADVPTRGQREHRCAASAPQWTRAWASACLAALQGGQARRTARTSKPKYRNRTLTARKQRFLTAVHKLIVDGISA